MGKLKPTQSALWAHINKTYITEERVRDLSGFKSGSVNFKLALWNPQTNGVRYLKTLIYNLCASLTNDDWKRISKMRNRHIGDPLTIKYNGEEVCLDYLQANYEVAFITDKLPVSGINILEIGAGYGRTCHAISSNFEVRAYYIIDLDNCLTLSRKYLQEVMDRVRFSKIHFISVEDVEDIDELKTLNFDLCINIDSFAEMTPETVKYYLSYVNAHADYLYVKNPVGKYSDASLISSYGNSDVQLALDVGVLREVVDVYDKQAIKRQVPRFVQAYQPGDEWECVANSWAPPWSYYWQALYKKLTSQGSDRSASSSA